MGPGTLGEEQACRVQWASTVPASCMMSHLAPSPSCLECSYLRARPGTRLPPHKPSPRPRELGRMSKRRSSGCHGCIIWDRRYTPSARSTATSALFTTQFREPQMYLSRHDAVVRPLHVVAVAAVIRRVSMGWSAEHLPAKGGAVSSPCEAPQAWSSGWEDPSMAPTTSGSRRHSRTGLAASAARSCCPRAHDGSGRKGALVREHLRKSEGRRRVIPLYRPKHHDRVAAAGASLSSWQFS